MKAFSKTFFILSLVAGLASTGAYGQLTALPVSFSPKELPQLKNFIIHCDFGFYNLDTNDFKSLALRVVWNPKRFSIMGGAGALFAGNNANDGFTVGTNLGYDLKPGTQTPSISKPIIQIKIGVGYTKTNDFKQWNIPFALGFGHVFPIPDYNVKVWLSPRLHLRVEDNMISQNDSNKNDFGYGLSLGSTFTSIKGPGIQVDLEILRIYSHWEFIIAAGLHWDFVSIK